MTEIQTHDDLKRRLVRAREVFVAARKRIDIEYAAGEIGQHDHERFLRLVDLIEIPTTDPDDFGEEHVAAVEAAVVALRDKAVELKYEGDICSGGLNRFLRACGLRRWSPYQSEGNSPWASDYPDDSDGDEY